MITPDLKNSCPWLCTTTNNYFSDRALCFILITGQSVDLGGLAAGVID